MEEEIRKDVSELSEKDLQKLLRKESPELLVMLPDLWSRLQSLSTEVGPWSEGVHASPPMVDGRELSGTGIDFADCKTQVTLSYCVLLLLYMLLKAERRDVRHHPLTPLLVRCRYLLGRSLIQSAARQTGCSGAETGRRSLLEGVGKRVGKRVGKPARRRDGKAGKDGESQRGGGAVRALRVSEARNTGSGFGKREKRRGKRREEYRRRRVLPGNGGAKERGGESRGGEEGLLGALCQRRFRAGGGGESKGDAENTQKPRFGAQSTEGESQSSREETTSLRKGSEAEKGTGGCTSYERGRSVYGRKVWYSFGCHSLSLVQVNLSFILSCLLHMKYELK